MGNGGTRYQIDSRTRRDFIEQIKKLAESYVPEWKFDLDDPDPLSVIARIFANQTEENIKRLNMVLHKYHIEFANMYGMSRKPAIPAKTICTLGADGGNYAGVELRKGTQVIGTTPEGDEVTFAFCHDISVISAKLTEVVEVSAAGKKAVAYNAADGFPLFSYRGENIHRQAVAMCFDRPLDAWSNVPDNASNEVLNQRLRLRFGGDFSAESFAKRIADPKQFTLSYLAGGETVPFDDVRCVDGLVEFWNDRTDGGEFQTVVLEMTGCVEGNIALNQIELLTPHRQMRPEFIWNGRSEVVGDLFCPFTEQPALYSEFFIGQELLFGQQGAALTLSFVLAFERFVANNAVEEPPELKIIKRKPKNQIQRLHYRCYIQEVTFEYFNGRGWKRLPASPDVSALFMREENAGRYEISFEAPVDWEGVVQGGYEGRCIRMQVVRADNCYMREVEYVYPVLSGLSIAVNGNSGGVRPRKVVKIQGAGKTDITARLACGESVPVFTQPVYGGDYVYWGFDRPLGAGPVSLFVELERSMTFKGLDLAFSYSAGAGFKPLKVVDDTDFFQNAGRILFMPPTDMAMREVEGRSCYWIRIEDRERYFASHKNDVPFVRRVYLNAVMVENMTEKAEQDYYIDAVMPDMRFPLYSDNILSVEVWVNEKEQFSPDEMRALLLDKTVPAKAEYNFLGEIEEFYILWSEVDSFENCGDNTRCYCIDRGRSEILFGDGVHVQVPRCLDDIAFRTRVVCCDGEKANIRAGSIDRFRGTVFSVEEVQNPIDAYGGTNLEDRSDALRRGSNILSSRRRMVSERDYIKETMAFSGAIEQVACVTGQMRSGGSDDAVISLVLLMKDYQQGSYSFRSIQEPLKAYLLSHCEITCGLSDVQIVEPVFVKISIDLWLDTPNMQESLELKHMWIDRIADFLEPVKRVRSNGWKIGRLPETRQIRLMLGSLEDTARITHMNVVAQYTDHQRDYTVELDRVERNPFMLCCNGMHNIYINKMEE